MLKKSQRLNLKYSFKPVMAESKRIETAHFKLFIQKIAENKYPKVGIALTKKEFKHAHERNRARRITSKIIEDHYSRLIPNINLVIMPKGSVMTTDIKELSNEIDSVVYLYSTH